MSVADLLVQVKNEIGLKHDFTVILLGFALMLARILPSFILTPMLGGDSTPAEVKLGLGVFIGMVIYPGIEPSLGLIPLGPVSFIGVLMKELFIGFCLSFLVGIVFDAALIAGQLMDNMAGTNMAQIMNPSIQQQVSLYADLQLQLFVTLFLTLNGHHLVIDTLADSLVAIPLESFPKFSGGMWPFFDLVMRVFGDLMKISMSLAAPVLLATFLTDFALGMINRVAPQVQVYFISMQIKPAVAVLVLFASIHLVMDRVTDEYRVMFLWVRKALTLLG